jgi:hypothetical protein
MFKNNTGNKLIFNTIKSFTKEKNGIVELSPLLPYLNEFISIPKCRNCRKIIFTHPHNDRSLQLREVILFNCT